MSTSQVWRLRLWTRPSSYLLLLVLLASLTAAHEHAHEHGGDAADELEGAGSTFVHEDAHERGGSAVEELEGAEAAYKAHESGEGHAHRGSHHHQGSEGEATLAVSTMLLGTISFIMSIFYLVNHRDDDIQLNTWKVLSSTIALFVAVLLFRGISAVFEALMAVTVKQHLQESYAQGIIILLKFLILCLWFAATHATIRRLCHQRAVVYEQTNRLDVNSKERYKGKLKRIDSDQKVHCWANLFSHMTGFATIALGVEMQHWGPCMANPWMTLIPVVIVAIFHFGLYRMSDGFRSLAQADVSEAVQLWCEHGEETENEISGLSLSFMCVQSLVFAVTSTLPPVHIESHGSKGTHPRAHGPKHHAEHGNEDRDHLTPWTASLQLGAVGIVCASITMVLVYLTPKLPHVHKSSTRKSAHVRAHVGLDNFDVYLTRWYFIIQLVFVMTTAWCFLFVSEWEVNRFLHACAPHSGDMLDPHLTMQRVLMALVVSFGSFILIFGLDYLHDLPLTDSLAEAAIRKVIKAMGILIGFSWEESFHASVAAFAELTSSLFQRTMVQFFLGLALAMIVVPAWRLYILQKVLRLTEDENNEHENRDENTDYAFVGTDDFLSRADTTLTEKELKELLR